MLHEVLMHLLGCRSEIFSPSGRLSTFSSLKTHVHHGELELLEEVLKLGDDFRLLKDFKDRYLFSSLPRSKKDSDTVLCGNYIQAFCKGLEEVFLVYTNDLHKIEHKLLRDPNLKLQYISVALQKYPIPFETLKKLCFEIETSPNRHNGCQLLDVIRSYSMFDFNSYLERPLYHCQEVFIQQIAGWILNGEIIDEFKEFFIRHNAEGLCELVPGYLPSYLPQTTLENILFIGQSVLDFDKNKPHTTNVFCTSSIMGSREREFEMKLRDLQARGTMDPLELKSVIDEIYLHTAQQIYKLVVEEGQLTRHLKLVKDFFLMGRGELYHEFISIAGNMLQKPPAANTQHELNGMFRTASHRVRVDELADTFELQVDIPSGQRTDVSTWEVLSLNYKVEWPLHTFFTPKALKNYSCMFRFLLQVKQVQSELQGIWASHREHWHWCDAKNHLKWALQNNMSFLVDNLLFYLQVDVLDSQYAALLEKIDSTQDFEKIQRGHEVFQVQLLAKAFVYMTPVASVLTAILKLCRTFCATHIEANEQMLLQYDADFQERADFLFTILSELRHKDPGQHVSQLMLRINYNKWFTKQDK